MEGADSEEGTTTCPSKLWGEPEAFGHGPAGCGLPASSSERPQAGGTGQGPPGGDEPQARDSAAGRGRREERGRKGGGSAAGTHRSYSDRVRNMAAAGDTGSPGVRGTGRRRREPGSTAAASCQRARPRKRQPTPSPPLPPAPLSHWSVRGGRGHSREGAGLMGLGRG